MSTEMKDTPAGALAAPEGLPEGTGRVPRSAGKRKATFRLPPPAAPVKGLLLAATPEESQAAHRVATAILETWLGKRTRADAAKALGVPVVRMKQLGDAALSGMVAGLLRQPKRMPKIQPLPEEDPKRLRKALAEAERKNGILEELVVLLRDLPANRALAQAPGPEAEPGGKKNGTRERERAAHSGRVAAHPGGAPAGRSPQAGGGAGSE